MGVVGGKCERCGERLPVGGRGRIPRYCSTRCRVAAHRASGSLPADLTAQDRWVRHTDRKVPVTTTGRAASVTDPRTWTTYRNARAGGAGSGIGFVLAADGIVCIDLDHCLIDGNLNPWARSLIESCPPTYIEVSPSGDGLHVWGRGDVRLGRRVTFGGGDSAEVYGTGRYITVTHRRHGDAPAVLADLSDVITHLTA